MDHNTMTVHSRVQARRRGACHGARLCDLCGAQNLGIAPKILSRWKGEHQQHRDAAFPARGIKRQNKPNSASTRGQSAPADGARHLKKSDASSPPTAHEISLHSRGTADVSDPAALCRLAGESQWILSVCAPRRRPGSADPTLIGQVQHSIGPPVGPMAHAAYVRPCSRPGVMWGAIGHGR